MKTIFKSLIIAVSVLTVYSCNNSAEDYYSLGDIYISMGLIGTDSDSEYDFVIYCDNGDTLLPIVNATNNFETHNDQRVIINYTILDEEGNSDHLFYVRVNNLHDVLYKDIIELTIANSDSLGSDPVQIQDIWIAKNMLNIEFKYKGNYEMHYINLCYRTNENGIIDKPVELELRHNANGDEESLVFDAIVSFKLDQLVSDNKQDANNSIDFVVKSFNYKNEEQTYSGNYNGY